ncbi:FAD-dependent monooxygenase [Amycolatopsis sp.]|uniref:FAD-dependent monooxygenase n=1 Tax=Amycolatopsis sp. TaxID=37632 RepID=UPI002CD45ED8|nr:FAD-dependent monooxygenase [Amycolatopsis sp.]HVV10588.1 FAD-dependent monooxygenase [Amycolatopsis sp.]
MLGGGSKDRADPVTGEEVRAGLSAVYGDAVELGRKLAAAVGGTAAPGLLDSYHGERHRVAAGVLLDTQVQGLAGDWAGTGNPDLAPLRASPAEVFGLPAAARWLAGMMSGLDIRYPMPGEHPLLGPRMPDRDLADGGAVYERLRAGRGLLPGGELLIRPDGHVCHAPVEDALARGFSGPGHRVPEAR